MYDVSEFVSSHPGGDKIMLAAGGSLEPFFELYGIHKTREVMAIVEVGFLAIGMEMIKEVPSPNLLFTVIVPAISLIMLLTIPIPRPVPCPTPFVVKKLLNILPMHGW